MVEQQSVRSHQEVTSGAGEPNAASFQRRGVSVSARRLKIAGEIEIAHCANRCAPLENFVAMRHFYVEERLND